MYRSPKVPLWPQHFAVDTEHRLRVDIAAGDMNEEVALLPDQRLAVGLGAQVFSVQVRSQMMLLLAQLVPQLGDSSTQLLLILLEAGEAGQHLPALPQVVLQEGVHLPHTGHLVSTQTCNTRYVIPMLWIRIQIGSVFRTFVDPDPYSEYGFGSRQVNIG